MSASRRCVAAATASWRPASSVLERGSLTRRLVLVSLVWIVLAVAGGGLAIALAFRAALGAAEDARLEAWLHALVASLRAEPGGGVVLARGLGDPRFDQIFSGLYWQIESQNRVVAASRSLWDARLALPAGPDLEAAERVASGGVAAARTSGSHGWIDGPRRQRLRFVAERVVLQEPAPSAGETSLRVAIAADDEETQRAIAKLDRLLALSLGGLAAGLAAAVALQVRFGLAPVGRLVRALDAVRAGDRERLPETGPRELAPLIASMNALLDDESERLRRARAQAGNLAHALRTPLSLLALDAAAIRGAEGDVLRCRLEEVRREIEQRMARAAIAGPLAVRGMRTPLAEVARAVAGTLSRLFPQHTIEVDVGSDLAFRGDREDLVEMLGNLGENACKWAHHRVRISAGPADPEAESRTRTARLVLRVDDDGPGLAEEDAARAGERGVRLDERTPGAGLGLAIVTDIAVAHGGSLRLIRSPLGGLRAELTIPAAGPLPEPPA